ncbi:hypothetical protein BX667DRAFT_501651 [Coemansia mojavensis]|nr:hypothetical protein BX667DRAFT_501651 [Coemansia mojavensis]
MQLNISFAILAASAFAYSNAAVLKPRQGDKFGIEDMLSSVKSIYHDPAAVEYYASVALDYVSPVLPPSGSIPSKQDLSLALAIMEDRMAPSMISSLISVFDDTFEEFGTRSTYSSEIAHATSVLYGSSVSSRLNDVMQQLLHDITSDYGDGIIGQPTAAVDEGDKDNTDDRDDDTVNNHVQEENETQEEHATSGAIVISTNMLLLSVAAAVGCLF